MSKASGPSDSADGSRFPSPRKGRAEAEALARRIAGAWKPAHIYTSPMERSVKTAEAIAQACRLPGGEACANALRYVLARHARDTIVIVGHDSVNRALLLQFLDLPLSAYWRLEQSPCCLNEIDVENGEVRIRRINETRDVEEAAPQ